MGKIKLTFRPKQATKKLLKGLKDRDQYVITNRFGLETGERRTLESIGQEYGITRERVRQIENYALNAIRKSDNFEEAQIIFEEQKKKRNELPLDTFIDIIRTGGGMFKEIMSKTLETGVREFSHVKEIMDEKRKNTEAKRPSPLIDEMNELKRKIAALEKKLK